MKAKGGALRDRKTCLNLRLDNGRRHGVYVSECVMFQRCQHTNVTMFLCVIIGRMQHGAISKRKVREVWPKKFGFGRHVVRNWMTFRRLK